MISHFLRIGNLVSAKLNDAHFHTGLIHSYKYSLQPYEQQVVRMAKYTNSQKSSFTNSTWKGEKIVWY